MQYLIYLPVIILGLAMSIQDWKCKNVNIMLLILFFIFCLTTYHFFKNFCIVPFIVFTAFGALSYIFKKLAIFGSADYITIFSISFLL
ncbi:MAG: hypothetical protein LBE97_01575, partial [Holosporales bacterium]|nr:hypothetical protein [Holosporales bacterium]